MKVLVLGGSGFVGRHLIDALRTRGDDAFPVSLRDPDAAAGAAAMCDAIVNLSGSPVAQRWNAAVKLEIESSRVELQYRFFEALAKRDHRASAYVCASGIGYYGTSETKTFVEDSGPGDDFLAHVTSASERIALGAQNLGMRVALVRTGVVLGLDGGAIAKMLPAFRLGAGGVIGDGRQWFSWIHIDDAVGIYLLAIDRAAGPLNATAPEPVTNAQFTLALGAALHRPTFFPTPTFALRMLLGEGANVLLHGQRVIPERTLAEGYTFKYPLLEAALTSLLA
jgi:uncharacterized protein (TIGR01777 family)